MSEATTELVPLCTKGLSQDNRIGRKESGDWQERNERTGELAERVNDFDTPGFGI
jgi:hypothetical protein